MNGPLPKRRGWKHRSIRSELLDNQSENQYHILEVKSLLLQQDRTPNPKSWWSVHLVRACWLLPVKVIVVHLEMVFIHTGNGFHSHREIQFDILNFDFSPACCHKSDVDRSDLVPVARGQSTGQGCIVLPGTPLPRTGLYGGAKSLCPSLQATGSAVAHLVQDLHPRSVKMGEKWLRAKRIFCSAEEKN